MSFDPFGSVTHNTLFKAHILTALHSTIETEMTFIMDFILDSPVFGWEAWGPHTLRLTPIATASIRVIRGTKYLQGHRLEKQKSPSLPF